MKPEEIDFGDRLIEFADARSIRFRLKYTANHAEHQI